MAEFADPAASERAYAAIRDAETGGRMRVGGVLAVPADADGVIHVLEMTDHSTETGLTWGAVGGLALGVRFPPSVLASTIAWGAVGGVLGKLRNVHHGSQVADQLDGAIGVDRSGIVALVHAGCSVLVAEHSLSEATRVTVSGVDEDAAREITQAARQVG